MYFYAPQIFCFLWWWEQVIKFSVVWIKDSWELPFGQWELNLGFLQEQLLLTTEPLINFSFNKNNKINNNNNKFQLLNSVQFPLYPESESNSSV